MKRQVVNDNSVLDGESDMEALINDRGPYFDKSASKNVTGLVGKMTHLSCRIGNLGNRTVSFKEQNIAHNPLVIIKQCFSY